LRLRTIRSASAGVEGAAAERDVLQDLDEDPAQAHHRHRAEHRVAGDAERHLDRAGDLLGHQDALEAALPGACWRARSSSVAKPSRTASASWTPRSTPPISDLCRMSGERIFSTTG
jgi:hypothetical protein